MYGLTDMELNRLLAVLYANKRVEQVILYGSRARGTHHKYSDIDIALVGPSLGIQDLATLDMQMEDLYMPYKVDLCAYHRITNPALLQSIDTEGKPLVR